MSVYLVARDEAELMEDVYAGTSSFDTMERAVEEAKQLAEYTNADQRVYKVTELALYSGKIKR